jgi:hypothetical protein
MYLTIKNSIEVISKRMNTGNPLSKSEVRELSKSIEEIIADAKLYGPPERPQKQVVNM